MDWKPLRGTLSQFNSTNKIGWLSQSCFAKQIVVDSTTFQFSEEDVGKEFLFLVGPTKTSIATKYMVPMEAVYIEDATNASQEKFNEFYAQKLKRF